MKLCITEKPSVAKDIAQIIGANVKRDGYYEGGDYKVTWTFGHLCTLKEPHDYSEYWKRWSLAALPMIPPKFGIKLIDDEGIKRQFRVIETLISQADEVINCGDAGQEGELIQRWVMQKAKINCPVQRLWISSLTDESIRDGFKQLQPQQKFDNLYYAGLSRAIGDWILGMNHPPVLAQILVAGQCAVGRSGADTHSGADSEPPPRNCQFCAAGQLGTAHQLPRRDIYSHRRPLCR